MPRWAADRYDALPLPHEEWGQRVVDGLALEGTETVVDLGCGTGRDLGLVLGRLPRGRVLAVDQSAEMLTRLRDRIGDDPRVEVVQADLHEGVPLPDGVADVVMSVAALHWLRQHDTIWHEVARLLRPGGRLRAECGGEGNVARVAAAVRAVAGEEAIPAWTFEGVEATEARLQAAGLVDVQVGLRAAPAVFDDDETFREYLRTLVLHDLDDGQVAEVAERLGNRTVDYVRLEVAARRPG